MVLKRKKVDTGTPHCCDHFPNIPNATLDSEGRVLSQIDPHPCVLFIQFSSSRKNPSHPILQLSIVLLGILPCSTIPDPTPPTYFYFPQAPITMLRYFHFLPNIFTIYLHVLVSKRM